MTPASELDLNPRPYILSHKPCAECGRYHADTSQRATKGFSTGRKGTLHHTSLPQP
jgi:hypothetical protein